MTESLRSLMKLPINTAYESRNVNLQDRNQMQDNSGALTTSTNKDSTQDSLDNTKYWYYSEHV